MTSLQVLQNTNVYQFYPERNPFLYFLLGIADLQIRVKDFLDINFKDSPKHDWLEDGHTFPLMQYYTDLVWTRMVQEAMGKKGKTMKGMDEILKIPGAGIKCIRILVEGRPY